MVVVHVLLDYGALLIVDVAEMDLVLLARSGNVGAFSALVERYWFPLVRFARSIAGEAEAEDIVQDALVAAWSKISGLRHPEAFAPWMLRIVARRSFRRTRWRIRQVSLEHADDAPDPAAGSGTEAVNVERVLSRLAPRQRAVMHLTLIEGMTDGEISVALGITPASVRSHRRRAREALHGALMPADGRGV